MVLLNFSPFGTSYPKMSSKPRKNSRYSEKDVINVRRFVHDVMMYTLPKCGLPEARLPSTNDKVNVYNHANFLDIAGMCTLRAALSIRDACRLMFISRRNSFGFNKKNISSFIVKVVKCTGRRRSKRALVEKTLALCNEIIMFFYSEDIFFDLNSVIDSVGCLIIRFSGLNGHFLERLEVFFEVYEDLWKYSKWVPHFIAKFAIPYGSREDVSKLFYEHSHKFQHVREKIYGYFEEMAILFERIGFLPHEIVLAIIYDESTYLPEHFVQASGLILPGNRESPEPPEWPANSGSCIVTKRNSTQSVTAPE